IFICHNEHKYQHNLIHKCAKTLSTPPQFHNPTKNQQNNTPTQTTYTELSTTKTPPNPNTSDHPRHAMDKNKLPKPRITTSQCPQNAPPNIALTNTTPAFATGTKPGKTKNQQQNTTTKTKTNTSPRIQKIHTSQKPTQSY